MEATPSRPLTLRKILNEEGEYAISVPGGNVPSMKYKGPEGTLGLLYSRVGKTTSEAGNKWKRRRQQ